MPFSMSLAIRFGSNSVWAFLDYYLDSTGPIDYVRTSFSLVIVIISF